jgi:hypothetical protein
MKGGFTIILGVIIMLVFVALLFLVAVCNVANVSNSVICEPMEPFLSLLSDLFS